MKDVEVIIVMQDGITVPFSIVILGMNENMQRIESTDE